MVGGDVPRKASRPDHGKKANGISQMEYMPEEPTIATRRVVLTIADGYDPVAYNGVKAALSATGKDKGSGKGVIPDHHLEGMRSAMSDSIFIPGGAKSIETLRKNGRAFHWVREAFGHLRAIGPTGEAVSFVRDGCQLPGIAFSNGGEVVDQ